MKLPEKLELWQLQILVKQLRQYGDMSKKLWIRGRKLFSDTLAGKKNYSVEYFPVLGEDEAFTQASQILKKSFWVTPAREEIVFHALENLKGGMRVIVDDKMVDVSYAKVEKLLQK